MKPLAQPWVVAAVALVWVLAGCSSSGGKSASSSTTASTSPGAAASGGVDAAFRARAMAVCQTAGSQLRSEGQFPYPDFDPEHPDAADLPKIADFEAKTVANERQWQSGLVALGNPSTDAAAWTTFLGVVDQEVAGTVAQQEAAQRGATGEFTQTFHQLTALGPAATRDAQSVGLPLCDPGKLGS